MWSKLKDFHCKTALSIPEMRERSPLSHSELILWNLAQASDSSGTFFSVQAWPKIETHQWLRSSFPGAAGFTLFGSVVIHNSRQLVKLLLSLILLLKKHYPSNNNNHYFCQLKYYYNSNGSLETRWGNPDLLSPFRCGIKVFAVVSFLWDGADKVSILPTGFWVPLKQNVIWTGRDIFGYL